MDAGAFLDPVAFIIRTAMPDRIGHPLKHRAVARADEAGYAAHKANDE